MSGTLGSAFSSTDPTAMAPGTLVDAGVRRHRNTFNFADSGVGGTANPLTLARLRRGNSTPEGVRLQTDGNLSGITVSVGIAGTPAKYAAAQTGPNATSLSLAMVLAQLVADSLATEEEIILTPSGNWPASGTLYTNLTVSKR